MRYNRYVEITSRSRSSAGTAMRTNLLARGARMDHSFGQYEPRVPKSPDSAPAFSAVLHPRRVVHGRWGYEEYSRHSISAPNESDNLSKICLVLVHGNVLHISSGGIWVTRIVRSKEHSHEHWCGSTWKDVIHDAQRVCRVIPTISANVNVSKSSKLIRDGCPKATLLEGTFGERVTKQYDGLPSRRRR